MLCSPACAIVDAKLQYQVTEPALVTVVAQYKIYDFTSGHTTVFNRLTGCRTSIRSTVRIPGSGQALCGGRARQRASLRTRFFLPRRHALRSREIRNVSVVGHRTVLYTYSTYTEPSERMASHRRQRDRVRPRPPMWRASPAAPSPPCLPGRPTPVTCRLLRAYVSSVRRTPRADVAVFPPAHDESVGGRVTV
jgi:hypothetical protein